MDRPVGDDEDGAQYLSGASSNSLDSGHFVIRGLRPLRPQDSSLLWARLNAETSHTHARTHIGVSAALYMFD